MKEELDYIYYFSIDQFFAMQLKLFLDSTYLIPVFNIDISILIRIYRKILMKSFPLRSCQVYEKSLLSGL